MSVYLTPAAISQRPSAEHWQKKAIVRLLRTGICPFSKLGKCMGLWQFTEHRQMQANAHDVSLAIVINKP